MTIKKVVLIVLLIQLCIAGLALYQYNFQLEALQAITRYSGRFSLAVFSIIFLFLPGNGEKLSTVLSTKPFHVFAIVHGIHLIELLAYVYLSGNELIPVRLAGGFLAYCLIFAMPIIHTKYESGNLPIKNYTILQTIYLYYVWFIFFMSYLPRVQGKLSNVGGTYAEFVVLLCWVCMLLGMKLPALIFQKRTSSR